jgi:hypothetical protein
MHWKRGNGKPLRLDILNGLTIIDVRRPAIGRWIDVCFGCGILCRTWVQRCHATQEIHPNSPAGAAGLRSHTDYIIGTADAILHDQSDFYYVIEQHNKRPLRLYVYNSDDDSCRETTIVPDNTWGGEGRYATRARPAGISVQFFAKSCARLPQAG